MRRHLSAVMFCHLWRGREVKKPQTRKSTRREESSYSIFFISWWHHECVGGHKLNINLFPNIYIVVKGELGVVQEPLHYCPRTCLAYISNRIISRQTDRHLGTVQGECGWEVEWSKFLDKFLFYLIWPPEVHPRTAERYCSFFISLPLYSPLLLQLFRIASSYAIHCCGGGREKRAKKDLFETVDILPMKRKCRWVIHWKGTFYAGK